MNRLLYATLCVMLNVSGVMFIAGTCIVVDKNKDVYPVTSTIEKDTYYLKNEVKSHIGKTGALVLFVDEKDPIIKQPQVLNIENVARRMGLKFLVINNEEGLPQDVTTLPSIFFHNDKGRSQYYGRYTDIPRIKNFVRTSSVLHKNTEKRSQEDILIWKSGRADITIPRKITKLKGKVTGAYDSIGFLSSTHQAIASGMNDFNLENRYSLSHSTKAFYLNIYPYLSDDDCLYITYEIFSQYNCVKPVGKRIESTTTRIPWKDKEKGFKEIGCMIEEEIKDLISNSDIGDSFQPVSSRTATLPWKSLGLDVNLKNEEISKTDHQLAPTKKEWKVDENYDKNKPIGVFSFLSPVDNYAGEIKSLSGGLLLKSPNSLKGAKGKFHVDISDVTMGSPELDYQIHNKILQSMSFPQATFEFNKIKGMDEDLILDKPIRAEIDGKFTMLGKPIRTTVDAHFEVTYEGKTPKLSVNCTFSLPLFDAYKIEGPDGPSPAKDIIQIYLNFNLI